MSDCCRRSTPLLLLGQEAKPTEAEEFDRQSDFLHRTNHSPLSGIDGPEDLSTHHDQYASGAKRA